MPGGVEVLVSGPDATQVAEFADRLSESGLDVVAEPSASPGRIAETGPDCVVHAAGDGAGLDDHLPPGVDVPVVVVAGPDGPDPGAALAAGAAEHVSAAAAADAPELLVARVRAAARRPPAGGSETTQDAPQRVTDGGDSTGSDGPDPDEDGPAQDVDGSGSERARMPLDDERLLPDGDGPVGHAVAELLAALDVPVWLLRDEAVAYANPACAELLGVPDGDLVGTPVAELAAPSDRDVLASHVDALASGDAERREDEFTAAGTLGLRTRVAVAGCRLADGWVLGRLADVEAEQADRRRVDALFEHLAYPVADVALADAQATVHRVNDAFVETFGLDADAVAGEYLLDHVVPPGEDHEQRALECYHTVERGRAVAETVTRETADGRRELELQALPYEAGLQQRALFVYVDVSEHAEREARLGHLQAATRELLAATGHEDVARIGASSAGRLLDDRPVVVYEYDEDEDALVPAAATEAAGEMYGELPAVPRGGGRTWYAFELGDPVVDDDVAARNGDDDRTPDRPAGSELLVPLDDHGILVACDPDPDAFDDADEALARTLGSTLAAAYDRADREALLREREAELRRQNERLDEFAGIVSHDLRSPLTVVKGNATLLREQGDVEHLDRIERAADRMDDLIEDLLDLARQGDAVDDPVLVELDELVTEAWTTADTREATLEADVDVPVTADPGRLRQLFENLFGNAVEHGGDDVTVRVGTIAAPEEERPGGQYGRRVDGFYVSDDGPGLPEEERGELFEPGVTTEDDGTGFGLSIVKRVAEAHGWTVSATESEAGGARFEFTGLGNG